MSEAKKTKNSRKCSVAFPRVFPKIHAGSRELYLKKESRLLEEPEVVESGRKSRGCGGGQPIEKMKRRKAEPRDSVSALRPSSHKREKNRGKRGGGRMSARHGAALQLRSAGASGSWVQIFA